MTEEEKKKAVSERGYRGPDINEIVKLWLSGMTLDDAIAEFERRNEPSR